MKRVWAVCLAVLMLMSPVMAMAATAAQADQPKQTPAPASRNVGYVTVLAKATVYLKADASSDKLGSIKKGKNIGYSAIVDEWTQINYNGKNGWVETAKLKVIEQARVDSYGFERNNDTKKITIWMDLPEGRKTFKSYKALQSFVAKNPQYLTTLDAMDAAVRFIDAKGSSLSP